MFYGRGAGKEPTASAMAADIIDAAKHMGARKWIGWQPSADREVLSPDRIKSAWYVRTEKGGLLTAPMDQAEYGAWAAGRKNEPLYRIRVL